MKTINGKYTSAKIMTNNIEESALTQIQSMCDMETYAGCNIIIMPDVHAGLGSVIGFTSTFNGKLHPQVVGVDIGCGVLSMQVPEEFTKLIEKHLPEVNEAILESVPVGFHVNNKDNAVSRGKSMLCLVSYDKIEAIFDRVGVASDYAYRSIGTLGGGNHFIEIGKSSIDGSLWITIHTGSRNFGNKVCQYHEKVILDNSWQHLENEALDLYAGDMRIAQYYAKQNRMSIMNKIVHAISKLLLSSSDDMYWGRTIESVHNYIDFDKNIIRKGAIDASYGKELLIPFNMRDGILVGTGFGNKDWNFSAPHGAGRILGRNAARKTLSMEEYRNNMDGIYSTCVNESTLDEAPSAYKNAWEITELIEPTVDVLFNIEPILNIKATESHKK